MLIERVQRDFSSAKIKRNDMGSLLGEEMRCTCSEFCSILLLFLQSIFVTF